MGSSYQVVVDAYRRQAVWCEQHGYPADAAMYRRWADLVAQWERH